ncbi:MAG: hypothetical protein WBE88_04820, partial [Candidatus Acidiferrales bacterium]
LRRLRGGNPKALAEPPPTGKIIPAFAFKWATRATLSVQRSLPTPDYPRGNSVYRDLGEPQIYIMMKSMRRGAEATAAE